MAKKNSKKPAKTRPKVSGCRKKKKKIINYEDETDLSVIKYLSEEECITEDDDLVEDDNLVEDDDLVEDDNLDLAESDFFPGVTVVEVEIE
jgi:hypothetical protein